MTGHLLGAAGAVEAMATVLAVQNDIVPPTINHEAGDEDPEIDYNLNFTFNKAQKREVRAGLPFPQGEGAFFCPLRYPWVLSPQHRVLQTGADAQKHP